MPNSRSPSSPRRLLCHARPRTSGMTWSIGIWRQLRSTWLHPRARRPRSRTRRPTSQAERVVDWVEIFAPLTSAERTATAGKLKRRTYEKGDRLLDPGTLPQSMFIIGSGVLSFSRRHGDRDVEVLRLGPGDHYGEIGVLTSKPSTAMILAMTPVTLYELEKADLGRIVEAR